MHRCFLLFLLLAAAGLPGAPAAESWPFITRRGDQLYEGERVFRTFSLTAPNLLAHESQLRADLANRFPDEYEIRDLFGALQRVGGRATRTFSFTVFHPDDHGIPVHIPARRTYNEEAFRCLDRVLALAREYEVRLIIPFIASQSFARVRGVDEFAALAGKPGSAFWTDPEVKEDFKHFLHFVLNRRNTLTGVLYKDDPAILAWQLGNEFGSYPYDRQLDPKPWSRLILAWSLEMATYLKQQDPRHLVMEAGGCDRAALLQADAIDIISDHLYEYWNRLGGRPTELGPLARAGWAECTGRKVLLIDEFGLATFANQRELLRTIREDTRIAGALLWSARSHRRDGGWFYHNEGGTPVNSFHVPGFATGAAYDETRVLDLLRREAYAVRGEPVPPREKPAPAPVLLPLGAGGFTWRGATGASSYVLERAPDPDGPWTVIARDLQDSVVTDVKTFESSPESAQPVPLYFDEEAPAGATCHYRIKGVNVAGETAYSPVVTVRR